jgi:zinc protease
MRFFLLAFPLLLAAQPAANSYKTIKFPALRDVVPPKVEQFTLSNGMKVYLLEEHELPLVSGSALVRTGNLFDPKDKVGLAGITGTNMRSGGTKTKTGEELDRMLESLAASVESGIGETSGSVSFSTLKENLGDVMGVWRDVLTQPGFRQAKLDLSKTQTRSMISRRNDEADGIVDREFAGVLYGKDNPYGWETEYVHIDAIQREDVVAFYERYFFPANITLSLYGDFNAAEMKTTLERLFGDWKVTRPPVPAFPPANLKAAPGVYLARKPDVTQSFFAVGHQGGKLNDPDYAALNVMSNILGEPGGFSSRLVQEIRVKQGLAYSVSSQWGANFNHPGLFKIEGSTKAESTAKTLQLIQEEISKIRGLEVSDAELTHAKNVILNSFVFTVDRPSKTLNRMVSYAYQGYPADFLARYKRAVEAVTKADIKRAAEKYLRPENFTYVVAGNPDKFDDKTLKGLGLPVKEVDLKIPEPKKAAVSPEAAAAAKALLSKAVTFLGGQAALDKVKDYEQATTATVGPGMQVQQKNWVLMPGIVRQETTGPFGKIVAFFDGAGGFIKTPQGEMPVQGPVLGQLRQQLFTEFFSLLNSNQKAGRTVNLVGPGTLEISEGSMTGKLTIDEATGEPKKFVMPVNGPQGPVEAEYQYSDFKDVGGVKYPHKTVIFQAGSKASESVVSEMKANVGLKAEELSKKP